MMITRHNQNARPTGIVRGLLLLLALQFCAGAALATTIRGMSIDEVANQAELIFEGVVLTHAVQRESGSGLIHTYVTFSVADVIKGNFSGDTLELRFTGGEYNGEIVEVSGLSIPPVGEAGIYFVESATRALLNPLLGWSQGHYVIVEENGERQVNTASREPVLEVRAMADIPVSIRRPQPLIEGKSDAAGGVITDSSALSIERPLTVEQFKTRIRALVD
ncbi:MAG: hypothetical protein WD396_05570 [Pseudohongiellaceae bacterium]